MIPILTVVYHETEDHYRMAINTWHSFPQGSDILAVVNKKIETKNKYPSHIRYIDNDENCLAKAWNIGLKDLFKVHDYVIVSGLDSFAPSEKEIGEIRDTLATNPRYGVVAACVQGMQVSGEDIKHGDGSFSFFCISKACFEDVGGFDEKFKPAYFEDNDYLERLWQKGYIPKKLNHIRYMHVVQGTVKYGKESKKNYPEYMNRNLNLFKRKWGKVPEHLAQDIRFT